MLTTAYARGRARGTRLPALLLAFAVHAAKFAHFGTWLAGLPAGDGAWVVAH